MFDALGLGGFEALGFEALKFDASGFDDLGCEACLLRLQPSGGKCTCSLCCF